MSTYYSACECHFCHKMIHQGHVRLVISIIGLIGTRNVTICDKCFVGKQLFDTPESAYDRAMGVVGRSK